MRFDEFEGMWNQVLYVSATPGPYELELCGGEVVEQIIRPTGLVDPAIEVLSARRWPTRLSAAQFAHVTGHESFPEYLEGDVASDGALEVYANGEIVYRVRGIHAKVSVEWHYQAPEGTGDTHYSVMRGSKVHLSVRQ